MSKVFGYKRVSSIEQRFDRQDLGDGVDEVFEEKLSGKNRDTLGAISFPPFGPLGPPSVDCPRRGVL